MQISREKEIDVDGRKEKVRVTFDIPTSLFKTREQVVEECGDVGLEGRTTEQVIDETLGAISSSLVEYTMASLNCGSHFGEALFILQSSIASSGIELVYSIRSWMENEKMR